MSQKVMKSNFYCNEIKTWLSISRDGKEKWKSWRVDVLSSGEEVVEGGGGQELLIWNFLLEFNTFSNFNSKINLEQNRAVLTEIWLKLVQLHSLQLPNLW